MGVKSFDRALKDIQFEASVDCHPVKFLLMLALEARTELYRNECSTPYIVFAQLKGRISEPQLKLKHIALFVALCRVAV